MTIHDKCLSQKEKKNTEKKEDVMVWTNLDIYELYYVLCHVLLSVLFMFVSSVYCFKCIVDLDYYFYVVGGLSVYTLAHI